MTERLNKNGLLVAANLCQFVETQVLPGTGVTLDKFWKGFAGIVGDLAPKNIALLAERDRLQAELDAWHTSNPGPVTSGDASNPSDITSYRTFLEKIGYLVKAPKKVRITTSNVDAELAKQASPQLVEIGRHGLIARRGGNQGLLLPQVPVEWGWSREQFLAQTCRKAGLPPSAWRDRATEIYWFEAAVF